MARARKSHQPRDWQNKTHVRSATSINEAASVFKKPKRITLRHRIRNNKYKLRQIDKEIKVLLGRQGSTKGEKWSEIEAQIFRKKKLEKMIKHRLNELLVQRAAEIEAEEFAREQVRQAEAIKDKQWDTFIGRIPLSAMQEAHKKATTTGKRVPKDNLDRKFEKQKIVTNSKGVKKALNQRQKMFDKR